MQNYRLILVLLLGAGVALVVLVGFFVISLMRAQPAKETKLDTQPDTIDRRIESETGQTTPTPAIENDQSGPINFDEEVNEEQRRNNPDVYIFNRVPFENQYFRIEGIPHAEGNPDFSFIVSVKGPDAITSKTKLSDWLTELGLTPAQIASL